MTGYRAYRYMVAAAQTGRTGLPALAMGCVVLIVSGYMITALLLELALSSGIVHDPGTFLEGRTPVSMLFVLLCFSAWLLALALTLALVHRRDFGTLLGVDSARQFLWVLAALLLMQGLVAVLPPWSMEGAQQNTALGLWLALLPLSLLAVLIQVSAEEFLFRGYLQQALAARGLPPLVWIALPSALFGLAHYDVEAGRNAWLIVLWGVMFGALMADLTARAGSIGPAIAVHFVNNILAMLIVGLDGSLSGLALFVLPVSLADEAAVRTLLPLDFMFMLVSWLTARLALRR